MNSLAELYQTVLLCVSYAENVFLRRMQDVHSINKPLRRGKGGLLFVYDAPMAFLIQLCLTITQRNTQGIPLPSPLGEGLGVRPVGIEASWVRVCSPKRTRQRRNKLFHRCLAMSLSEAVAATYLP